LRGIAALMVVLYHYRQNLTGNLNPDLYSGIAASSHVFVDLFFVLSGFIIAMVYGGAQDWGSYIRNRIARIYPLHFVTTIVSLLIVVALKGGRVPDVAPQAVTHLLMVHGWGFHSAYILNYPSWSISVEFAAYLVFPLILWASRSPLSRLILLGVIVTVYGGLQWYGLGLELHERWPLARGIPGFALGVLVFRWRSATQNWPDAGITGVQMATASAMLCLMHYSLKGTYLVLPMALLVILTWEDRGILARFLGSTIPHYVGVLSYGIYLWHIPVRYLWYYAWPQLGINGEYAAVLFVGLCIVSTVIAAAMSYAFFERPARRWIRDRGIQRRAKGSELSDA